MPSIGSLVVDLQMRTAGLQQSSEQAKKSLQSVESTATKAGAALKALGATLAGGLAIGGLTQLLRSTLDAADQLSKLSQRVGISVEMLSELKFAAELSDVSLEQLQVGVKGLGEVLTKAGDATSREAQLLRALGVTARDPYEAIRQIADAFAKLPDGIEKTAAAGDLFGAKVGQALIPLLNGGSAGLDQMGESARRLGLIISKDTAKAAEEFNDNITKLSQGSAALGISLTTRIVGGLASFTTGLVKAKEEGTLLKKVMNDLLGVNLELAAKLPLVGAAFGALRDANAARLAREAAGNPALRASGPVRGYQPQPDPAQDTQAQLQCVLSGGTWDAKTRKCIPKPAPSSGPKPLTLDELLAKNAEKRRAVFEEAEATQGRAAEDAVQKQLEAEADLSLASLRRYEEAVQAADEQIARNREAAQSIVDLIDPTAQFVRQLEDVRRLVREGFLTEEQGLEAEFAIQGMIDSTLGLGKAAKETDDIGKQLGLTFSSAFEDAIVGGNKFRDVVKGLGQDIARILVRKSVTEPIAKGIGGLFDAGGSNILSTVGNWIGSLFKADGGPVTGGRPYIVGERGPELFVPGASGSIVPNHAMGIGNVTVNNYFVDVDARVRQGIAQATPGLTDLAVAKVSDLRRRGMAI